MGPDEYATRKELNLVFRYLLARERQNTFLVILLTTKLSANGVITAEEFQSLLAEVEQSPCREKTRQAESNLQEFLTIHNTVREYLDPEEG
jgi:hypothetical protein